MFFLSRPNRWSVYISESLESLYVTIKFESKTFKLLSNTGLLLYRSKTFHDKEPDTNDWIKTIPNDGVFFDVGANVGVFTILASTFCRKVLAFEPVAINYSVLNQNIMINRLDDVATAYCLAISDKSHFDTMRLSSNVVGSAHHTFGKNIDACHEEFSPVFKQGAFAASLDDLVYKYGFECPTYLKVDVDGNENLVMAGAHELLKDQRLRSILIELNVSLEIDKGLIDQIKSQNFELSARGNEAFMSNGMKVENLIFFRK